MFKHLTLASTLATTLTLTLTSASPLFHLSSTANLPIFASDYSTNPTASQVTSALWRSLSSCPTRHYAVVVEPQTLTYSSSDPAIEVPATRNAESTYQVAHYDGKVNINHVLNTILMDCLHHGVYHVKELDMDRDGLPELEQRVIDENIIFVTMRPVTDLGLSWGEYERVMWSRRVYTEDLVGRYFGERDYTLIYVREEEVPAVDYYDGVIGGGGNGEDGMEIVLGGGRDVV